MPDTGATRIELGLGRPKPRSSRGLPGHIVLTDRRLIIRHIFGRLAVPYDDIMDWSAKPAGRFGRAEQRPT